MLQEKGKRTNQKTEKLCGLSIVIFLTDVTGFGNPSTFGDPVNTPAMTRLAEEGIMYNLGQILSHFLLDTSCSKC